VKQYQSNAGPAGAEASLSEWHQRKQADHQQWRQQSSSFCCAMLQQQAGPGDTATCGICGSAEVMIRRAPRKLCHIAILAEPAKYYCVPLLCAALPHILPLMQPCYLFCRCMTCTPSQGPLLMCRSCDRELHQQAHLHKRQQYSGYWQDLPLVADTGDAL
jgi:hypothetical protein